MLGGFIAVIAGEWKHLIKGNLKNIGYSAIGFLYLSLSLALLLHIRSGMVWLQDRNETSVIAATLSGVDGYVLPLILIGSIWVNDTMAYMVGSFIGKTPLSKVSPKKTWEGTIGGVVIAVIIAWFTGQYIADSAGWTWSAIAAVAAIVGTCGDLLESKLKRMAGVKDSGKILPGHGGFLDRFDSLLLATPAVWLLLKAMIYF